MTQFWPVASAIPKMVYGHEERVWKCSAIGMVPISRISVGEGWVTFPDLDGSICSWTHFLRRLRISRWDLHIWSKLFCTILRTYSEVCFTPVPWSVLYYASAIGENLFTDYVASIRVNKLKLTVNSFGPCSIHKRLRHTIRNNPPNVGGICYGWFNIWCDDNT